MKTTKLFFTGLFLAGTLFVQGQSSMSSTLTRFGTETGTGGTGNTFFGYQTGKQTTGNDNTFIGHRTGVYNQNGSFNTYVGRWAGGDNDNDNNTCIGARSGVENYGSGNTFVGAGAGYDQDGSNNIFIGKYAASGVSISPINNKLYIENSSSTIPLIWGDFAEDQLKFNGKVGVGYNFGDFPALAGTVDVENYNLFVYGGILTEEVRVMLEGDWADYVFEENYLLPKLEEVEVFIKENKHLPNVPSAKEVAENGIELGKITTIQQEKIEELTLYLIQQQKELNELKEQVKLLLENQK
ncbi:MAG: hypothetical protein WCY06_01380 [Flavobacteriaceae bacterium]